MSDVFIQAVGVRISHDIQPVPSPVLAILRCRKQPINDFGERIRRVISQKRSDLVRRWRQPGEVKGCPADQCDLRGRRIRRQSSLFQSGQNKRVDRRSGELRMTDKWQLRSSDRLKGPELTSLLHVEWRRFGLDDNIAVRMNRAVLDPVDKCPDVSIRQFFFRRHLQRLVCTPNGRDQQTLLWLTRNDRRPGFSAPTDPVQGIEPKISLLFFLAVTRNAVSCQQRRDRVPEDSTLCFVGRDIDRQQ